MADTKRNLESGGLYINRWQTGMYTERSPLFIPMSAMGIQLITRMDTLWDGLNVEVSHNATLQRRPGLLRYCSAAFGASDYPLNYFSFKNTSGVIKAMVDTPTKVAWFDTTTINTIFAKSGAAQMSMQKVGDTVYMCNGTDADMKKWNGTTATKWGISAPVAAPALSFAAGALSPKSGYTYVFVYKNSSTGHISTASPVSGSTGIRTSQNITITGASSADTQVDKVDIYRTRDGGALYYYLATVNNGGTWSYTDSTADINLNDFLVAPLAKANEPPPSGSSLVVFHMGRLWVASGNILYFAGGADVTNGMPEECFPPANNFKFPGKITAIASLSQGLAVFTADDAYVVLGYDTASFYSQILQANFGVPSQNCIAQDGDLLFVFTSQGQLFRLNDVTEIGFPIRSKLAAYNPQNVNLALHRSGLDEGLFVCNGTDEVWRYSVGMENWSPVGKPAGGLKFIQSIEVATSNYRLMVGRGAGSGYILCRDTATFRDDGTSYAAWATVGSLIMAPPRQVALINSVLLETTAVGSYPTLKVLLNEISGTFTTLPNPVPDPPQLMASQTVKMMRHDLKAAQTPLPQHVRHMQVQVVWPAEAFQNELLGLAVS